MHCFTLLTVLAAPLLVLAKDGYDGCTSATVASNVVFYVPGTGEICDYPADCGGGRAPPKYSVPGCPAYTGTETRPARYIPGYGPNAAATPAPAAAAAAAPAAAAAAVTSSSSTASSSASSASSSSSGGVASSSSSQSTAASSLSSSSRAVVTSLSVLTTARPTNATVATSSRVSVFNGEAGRVGAQVGLVAFLGAVVAMV